MKKKILLLMRAAVSIALIAALLYMMRDSIPKMLVAVKNIPANAIIAAYLTFVGSTFIASFRLKVLLATKNISLKFIDLVKLTFVGYFFSSFLPTAVGGDVAKAFYISQASKSAVHSYTTVFMDRLLGMCSLFLIAIAALFFSKDIPKSDFNWVLPLFLFTCILLFVFLFNKRLAGFFSRILEPLVPAGVKEKSKEIYNAVHSFKGYKTRLSECLLISAAGQATAFIAVYIIAAGLGSPVPLIAVLLAMPVASIASMIPSIYGTGPREMSIVIILSPFIGKDKALAIAFLWLGLLLTTALIGGIIHLAMGRYKVKTVDLSNIR